jgi:PAS domain-containing protein
MTMMAILSYYIYRFDDSAIDRAGDAEKKAVERNIELQKANRELVSSQRELQNSEEKYRTIVELTEEIIWSSDSRGFFTFVNSAVERVYGYTPQEIIGYHLSKLTSAEFVRHETGVIRDMISKKLTSTATRPRISARTDLRLTF